VKIQLIFKIQEKIEKLDLMGACEIEVAAMKANGGRQIRLPQN